MLQLHMGRPRHTDKLRHVPEILSEFPVFHWQHNPRLFPDPHEKFSRTFSEPANV